MTATPGTGRDPRVGPETGSSAAIGAPPVAGQAFEAFAGSIAVLLSRALRVFAFEHKGEAVRVDGMRPRRRGESVPIEHAPGIVYEPPDAYLHSEPRIRLFVDLFARVLAGFTFTLDGEPVEVDGVRLANLRRWSRYREETLFDNVSPVSSLCSARCVFCYREGTRHGKLVRRYPRMLGMEEAETRARYWRIERRVGLPRRQADAGEPFLNPGFFQILDVVRTGDPSGVITLLTNGDYLDSACVRRLGAYKPLLLVLSVNTADVVRRRELMRPRNAENGVRAAGLLQDAGIPYIGSIVADQRLGLADIERTIRHLDRHGALRVRVALPGYTKHSLHKALPGLEDWWRQVAELVLRVRETVGCPVFACPALYWDTEVTPRVEGVHPGSAAKAAGVKIGDVVLEVNRTPVLTKADALRRLTASCEAGEPCTLRLLRGGREFEVELSSPNRGGLSVALRPAAGLNEPRLAAACRQRRPGDLPHGIFMNSGLDVGSFLWIRRRLRRFRARKRVLVFSSPLAQPHVLALAKYLQDAERGHELRTAAADHEFWGGNIQVADLHVVDDYIAKIRYLIRSGWSPDLVFIPDSFLDTWGLDIAGNSYRRIEAETGARTILVPVTRIME